MACTAQGNRVYSGKVSGEKIETEKLKLSFLLGAYLCYGKACDDQCPKQVEVDSRLTIKIRV